MLDQNQMLKTGTTTVGVKYAGGVVLGADKRATAGNMIVDKKTVKVVPITDKIAVTTAGSVSEIQMLVKVVRAELKLKSLRGKRESRVGEAANLLAGMLYNAIRQPSMLPSPAHFLVGGYDSTGTYLFDLWPDGSITEVDEFVSSGSGSVFALGVLEADWREDLDEEAATKLVESAIMSSLKRDSASGNGYDLMVIGRDGTLKPIARSL
jgi:proteasome beta subunit